MLSTILFHVAPSFKSPVTLMGSSIDRNNKKYDTLNTISVNVQNAITFLTVGAFKESDAAQDILWINNRLIYGTKTEDLSMRLTYFNKSSRMESWCGKLQSFTAFRGSDIAAGHRVTRATRNSYYHRSCKLRVTEKLYEFTAESGEGKYPEISRKIFQRNVQHVPPRALQLPECPCATWSFDKAPVGTRSCLNPRVSS